MNNDLNSAHMLLEKNGYTCVIKCGETIYTSIERGVRPLLQLLDSGTDCTGFSAADKVVGKAAAFLYCLLRVRAVYAAVISKSALKVLSEQGIEVLYDDLVDAIRNRAGTGFCPMETAVLAESDPKKALERIRVRLEELRREQGVSR